jgi:hypothetical protein
MSEEQDRQRIPAHIRRDFADAASAFLEVATKRGLSRDEISRMNETHDRVVEALRQAFGASRNVSAIRFRGKIFSLAPRSEALVVIPKDQIHSIDG